MGVGLLLLPLIPDSVRDAGATTISLTQDDQSLAFKLIIGGLVVRCLTSRTLIELVRTRLGSANSKPGPTTSQLMTDARRLQLKFVSAHPDQATLLSDLTELLSHPDHYFERIKEHVDVQSDAYDLRTTLTFYRQGFTGRCIMPLVQQKKGVLIDDLRIEVEGKPGRTLPYAQNQAALLWAAAGLLEEAIGAAVVSPVTRDHLDRELVRTIVSPRPEKPARLLRLIEGLPAPATTNEASARTVLRTLIAIGSVSYFIFGMIKHEDEPQKIAITSRVERVPTRGSGRFRAAFGLRPRTHEFHVDRAFETPSYHLSLRTPVGMYVFERGFRQLAERGATATAVTAGTPAPEDRRFNTSKKYLHAYVRGAKRSSAGVVPVVEIEVRERPPALLEMSLLLSAPLGLTVVMVGVFHDHIFSPDGKLPGAAPTVLFSIPLLLVGWLVSRIDRYSMARLSFTSLFMITWLAANSIASVLLAAAKSASTDLTSVPEGEDLWRVVVWHPLWAILMASCFLHLCFTVQFCISRAWRYAHAPYNLPTQRSS